MSTPNDGRPQPPTLADLRDAAVKQAVAASVPGGGAALGDFISPLLRKYEAQLTGWLLAVRGVR